MSINHTSNRMKIHEVERTPFFSAKRLFQTRVASLLLTCSILIFLTGCTDSTPDQNVMTEPSLPSVPVDTLATLPSPRLPNDSALTLRIAAHPERDMNPLTPKHTDTQAVFSLVYEPLMRMDEDGRMELVLAESADFNASYDMLRIKIRDQAVFHDGNPVRVEDARACLNEVIRQVTGDVPRALESPASLFSDEIVQPSESESEPIKTLPQDPEPTEKQPQETDDPEQGTDDSSDTENGTAENGDAEHDQEDSPDPISGMTTTLRDIVAKTTFTDALDGQRILTFPQEGGFDPAEYSTLYQYRMRALDNIDSVSIEEGVLYLGFHVPDQNAAQYLTFPVIPASFVRNTTSLVIPGSGEWKITPGGFHGYYSLHRVSSGKGISTIEVLPYDRLLDAVRAFDEGDIDLLFMDETTAPLYSSRSRIRKQRFEAPGHFALYFSGQKDSAIEARDRFRIALGEHPITVNELAAPHESARFPILKGDWRLFGSIEVHSRFDPTVSLTALERTGSSSPFVLLVPEGFLPARLFNRLEPLFLLQNMHLEIEVVAAADWFEKLREDDYDAAILTDVALCALDPVEWLDCLDGAGLWSWREYADASLIATLESLPACPVISDEESPEVRDAQYTSALRSVFDTVPVLGIGGLDTMVWYGSDVQGTMSGTWNAPYKEIERLTLWRP